MRQLDTPGLLGPIL